MENSVEFTILILGLCYSSIRIKSHFSLFSAPVIKNAPSLVYYVVPVAIALSVLLIIVLILLVYLKQRRKSYPTRSPAGQVPNGSALVVDTARVSKEDIGSPRVPGPLDKVILMNHYQLALPDSHTNAFVDEF